MARVALSAVAGAAALASAAVGCGRGDSSPAERDMREHFAEARAIETAVIAGDLEAARRRGRALERHVVAERSRTPDAWEPFLIDMGTAATSAISAGSISEQALAAAEVARSCGDCHAALRAEVTVATQPMPNDQPDHGAYMRRHRWAAERMWIGLATPSVQAWDEGTAALMDETLHIKNLGGYGDRAGEVLELAKRVHELAARGREETKWPERAFVYAQFLETCAACHKLTPGAGPPPAK